MVFCSMKMDLVIFNLHRNILYSPPGVVLDHPMGILLRMDLLERHYISLREGEYSLKSDSDHID